MDKIYFDKLAALHDETLEQRDALQHEVYLHRKVAELIKNIFDNSNFVVETFNESILINYLQMLGYPVQYKKCLRNLSKDFKMHCEETK